MSPGTQQEPCSQYMFKTLVECKKLIPESFIESGVGYNVYCSIPKAIWYLIFPFSISSCLLWSQFLRVLPVIEETGNHDFKTFSVTSK